MGASRDGVVLGNEAAQGNFRHVLDGAMTEEDAAVFQAEDVWFVENLPEPHVQDR